MRGPWADRIIKFVLVPALLLLSLWLPPVSLGVRLFHINYPLITPEGGSVSLDDGAQLAIPQGALSGRLRLLMTLVDVDSEQAGKGAVAAALEALPPNVDLLGPLYRFDAHGSQPTVAIFAAPLPAGLRTGGSGEASTDLLDLYAWTGEEWQWLPSEVLAGDEGVRTTLAEVPLIVASMQARPQDLSVGIGAPNVGAVNAAPLDMANELYVAGLSLVDDGTVRGEIALESAPAGLLVLPILSNRVDGVAHTDWVANLIANHEPRTAHVQAIVEAVNRGSYGGLSLEYEGLDDGLRDTFAAFVSELAQSLHQSGKVLAVRVDPPRREADGAWGTAGYDWAALGRAADLLRIPVLDDPSALKPGGTMEQCLRAGIRLVDRAKVQLIASASCYEQVGGNVRQLIYGDALSLASQVLVTENGGIVLPGEQLEIQLAHLGSGLQEDPGTGQPWFSFQDDGGSEHKVWIENSNSMEHKLALAHQFSLRGIDIDDLAGTANDARIWDAVRTQSAATSRSAAATTARGARYSVVWRVQSKDGELVQEGMNPANQPLVSWTAVEDPGDYVISVAISEDGGKTTLGEPGSMDVVIPTPTPSPTPTPTPQPTAAPRPQASAGGTTAAPPPAPAGRVGFGYGIQVDMVTDTNYDHILGSVQAMGFNWVKQQVEWFRYNPGPGQYDWGRLDAIVDACAARGIKVLFSVVKAPNWARPGDDDKSVAGPPADPNTYAEYMRQMAARYKGRVGAYEIWNEQNLWYEWGGHGGRLNAAKYVELLRAAYQAIKSVDPGAIVISGALTPTGWSDGDTAIDDQVYLRQMYDAGLRSVCDAVGAHPSGFNNPPDADWRSYTDPSASFTGPQVARHPSWYFRATMEGYRNIMVAYGDAGKRIIPTEFGWASVDGLGVPPARGYEYAADNTAQEQADYIARAYQLGRNWGFVGPMFLWNLNFAPICGPGDEKAAFSVVDCGWGARPAFNALASMPK